MEEELKIILIDLWRSEYSLSILYQLRRNRQVIESIWTQALEKVQTSGSGYGSGYGSGEGSESDSGSVALRLR